jgi:hypothetical protein
MHTVKIQLVKSIKSSYQNRNALITVALPSKHATFGVRSGQIYVRLFDLRSYHVVTAPFYKNGHATDDATAAGQNGCKY